MRNTEPLLRHFSRGREAGSFSSVSPASVLLGEDSWDLVVLVEYPSRQAFLDMIGSAEYQAIGHLRAEALARGELHPMDPAELA